jgi:hypothetical protein
MATIQTATEGHSRRECLKRADVLLGQTLLMMRWAGPRPTAKARLGAAPFARFKGFGRVAS